ncbi:MAG: DNA/RNA non-specific endonuclease [Gallionella sp.]|nr:DNA/RNA non-specific endonuclease [Gallionella sp.]
MLFKKLQLGLAVVIISLGSAFAADNDFGQCREVFAHGTPPVMKHSDGLQPRALCFSAFAVMHSGKSHTPIFVAERLNNAVLLEAPKHQRTNKFYSDARLPKAERAELDDYHGSGFDRGHMAPAGDMATEESMAQSFSLANMVPQSSANNRGAWGRIEKATRKYVMRASGDVYVITGPVYDGTPPVIGPNRVWVPQHLFKLVYDPSNNRTWVNWLDNTDDAKPGAPISYEELVKRTGIEFLPRKT